MNPEIDVIMKIKKMTDSYSFFVETLKKTKKEINEMAENIDNTFFIEYPYILDEFNKEFSENKLDTILRNVDHLSKDISEQLEDACKCHEYIHDTIDIDPEKSGKITYCKKCDVSKKGAIIEPKLIANDICVILTTTVIVNRDKVHTVDSTPMERISVYMKSIVQWLEKTNLKIVVVENSGYPFNELNPYLEKYPHRFEVIKFNERTMPDDFFDYHTATCLRIKTDYLYSSKGGSEMLSINHAKDKSKLVKNVNYIFKLTGRYFIPDFEEYVTKKMNIYSFVGFRQHNPNRCELIGVHKNYFEDMFVINGLYCKKCAVYHHHMEELVEHRFSFFPENKMCAFPVFKIEPTKTGTNYVFNDV